MLHLIATLRSVYEPIRHGVSVRACMSEQIASGLQNTYKPYKPRTNHRTNCYKKVYKLYKLLILRNPLEKDFPNFHGLYSLYTF